MKIELKTSKRYEAYSNGDYICVRSTGKRSDIRCFQFRHKEDRAELVAELVTLDNRGFDRKCYNLLYGRG